MSAQSWCKSLLVGQHWAVHAQKSRRERLLWRCPWCNGYRRRKWTRWHEFKSWTRLIAFHIALIPLGKEWIQIFSLHLWVNSRADWVLQPCWGNYSRRRKTLNSNLLNSAKNWPCVISCSSGGVGKYDKRTSLMNTFLLYEQCPA